jgi:glycosyltransferase involved in cell wall biosynthesis
LSEPGKITIGICTRNRARSLRATLESLVICLSRVSAEYEVIVVDNGSNDDTARVAWSFADRLTLRVVHEPRAGISNARNCLLDHATGRYLICTDDDTDLDPDWLPAYLDAFRRWPDAALFGGPIEPRFEVTPPDWMREGMALLGGPYGRCDLGPALIAFAADYHCIPFGANYAVRTAVSRLHRYDLRLGNAPGRRRFGEETAAFLAILSAGHAGRWIPAARVGHRVPAERMSLAFVGAWFRTSGETQAIIEHDDVEAPVLGVPRWLWRSVVTRNIRYRLARTTQPTDRWLRRFVEYQMDLGKFIYWWRHRAERTAASHVALPSPSVELDG